MTYDWSECTVCTFHHIFSVQTCGQEQRVWQPMLWSCKRDHRNGPRSESVHLAESIFAFGSFFLSWAFTVFELSCGWKIHCATQHRVWSRMKQLDEQKDPLHVFWDGIHSFIFPRFNKRIKNISLVAHSWCWWYLVILSPRIAFGGLGTPGPRVTTWMSSLANAVLKLEKERWQRREQMWTSTFLKKWYQHYMNNMSTMSTWLWDEVFHMSTPSALPIPAEACQWPKWWSCFHIFWDMPAFFGMPHDATNGRCHGSQLQLTFGFSKAI